MCHYICQKTPQIMLLSKVEIKTLFREANRQDTLMYSYMYFQGYQCTKSTWNCQSSSYFTLTFADI
jgi:hypothetical protein